MTEDTTYVNGPLSFYYRNIDSYVARTGSPAENIPEMDFFDVDRYLLKHRKSILVLSLLQAGCLGTKRIDTGRVDFMRGFSQYVRPPTGGIIDEGVYTRFEFEMVVPIAMLV